MQTEMPGYNWLCDTPVLTCITGITCLLHYNLTKFSFSNRVVPIWNSLPDYVVSACSKFLKAAWIIFGETKSVFVNGRPVWYRKQKFCLMLFEF